MARDRGAESGQVIPGNSNPFLMIYPSNSNPFLRIDPSNSNPFLRIDPSSSSNACRWVYPSRSSGNA